MGYASRSGRAQTSSRNPRAFAVCDRCGMWYNHDRLRWQFDWRGATVMNTRVLVCNSCYDTPQEQLRAIVVPADPVPIQNPRTEWFVQDETNNRYTSGQNTIDQNTGISVIGGDNRITEGADNRVTQQTGEPPNGLNIVPGTDFRVPNNLNIGLPYGVNGAPETGFLPFVTYVVWNNDVYAPVTWLNDQEQVITWEPTAYPITAVGWVNNNLFAQSWINNNYVVTLFTQG